MEIIDNKTVSLNEYFGSNQSVYQLQELYFPQVYDVTKLQTFQNCSKWMEELRQNAEPDISIILVGNKIDLVEKDPSCRQVNADAAAEWARQHDLLFAESSSVTSYNVKHVFENLLQEIYNRQSRVVNRNELETGGMGSKWDSSSALYLGGIT